MQTTEPVILAVVSALFEENTYIAYFQGRGDCIVVDPGLEPEKIFAVLDEQNLSVAAILCTHGHADHIAGNAELKARYPEAPIIIGEGDASMLIDPEQNLSAGYGFDLKSPPADKRVKDGEVLELAGFHLKVLDTPGHSPGHVVFVLSEESPMQIFGGDVLFAGSIGRTDFPNCSFEVLKQSIHEKLFSLPDDALVLSGHGPTTTIGTEKRNNPFVGLSSRFQG